MNAREIAEALGASHFIEMPNRQSVVDSAVTMRMIHTYLNAQLPRAQEQLRAGAVHLAQFLTQIQFQ